ncbi:hypothetical protein GGR51DRAFT_508158 [Nemania sp. FL0031]|nr:hypothetical protein GGR51DRAFT_508158 [Nemania sp. FL0031]
MQRIHQDAPIIHLCFYLCLCLQASVLDYLDCSTSQRDKPCRDPSTYIHCILYTLTYIHTSICPFHPYRPRKTDRQTDRQTDRWRDRRA